MFGQGPAEPSSPSPLVAAPHPHKQRLTGLLGLPQLFQEPGGAQVPGCQPAPSSSRLVWALCCEYSTWHEPLPLLESRSAQSRAVHVARTTSPKEAPRGAQQNRSSFCLGMFIFHMSGGPCASHANFSVAALSYIYPNQQICSKRLCNCSPALLLPSELIFTASGGAEPRVRVGDWVMCGHQQLWGHCLCIISHFSKHEAV